MRSLHSIVVAIGLAAHTISVASAAQENNERLTPRLELPGGRYYVGQEVRARVTVLGGDQPPRLSIGKAQSIDVLPLAGAAAERRSATAIGTKTEITNLYRFPVRIVGRQAGSLAIPTIRVSYDGQTGVVPARTITFLPAPNAGRSSAFLGGVDRVDVSAEFRPESITLGDSCEFRVTLKGPGAVGSTRLDSIPGVERSHPGWRIQPLASESEVDPPSRTFRFRIRPDRAGPQMLGPIRVATLDPKTGTYQTVACRAVSLKVVDVPEFTTTVLGSGPTTLGRANAGWVAVLTGAIGLAFALGLLWVSRIHARRRKNVDPKRLATELIAKIEGCRQPRDLSETAMNCLSEFFRKAIGAPAGVLTPKDARVLAIAWTSSEEIGAQCESLVRMCDRSLYADDRSEVAHSELRALAISVLTELGRHGGAIPILEATPSDDRET